MRKSTSAARVLTWAATLAIACVQGVGQVNVTTQHNDIGRTGQNTYETILTPANVSSGNFGKLFSVTVDGQVYAQPLYLAGLALPNTSTHNVVFVATMHDSVYAFDADTAGAPLWQITLLDAAHGAAAGATTDPISDTGCTELAGTEIGITSTPVIDQVNGIIYVVGKTFENGYPVQRLHALDVKTGTEKLAPVTLSASVAGSGAGSSNSVVTFDPKWENQRAGLLLVNGIVYMAFGSYCESGNAHGWILAYNASTLQQTSSFNATPNGSGSGIWMSGAGLAADIPAGSPFGRMFVATGNGTYDATTPYTTNAADYGDDVLQLDLTNGVMKITDAFTPMDQASLQTNGSDLGSGGIMLLPDQALAGHTHQMLAGGKTGNLYLVDRDSLGGYSTTANNIIEPIIPAQVGGVFSAPAYWNNNVYYWGDEDTLKQFGFTSGLMNFWHSANSSESQSFPGSTPSISANGNSNGIVWNIEGSAWVTNGNANLLAHDAQNVATTLYSSATNATRDNPGPAVKFAVPTISNGKVYVATYGQLSVFGLLTAPDFTITAAQPSLSVAQGGTATDNITVGAINGFSGALAFSASGLPAGMTAAFAPSLTAGVQTMTISVAGATAAGTYPVLISGTAGTQTHSLTVSVTVTSSGAPTPSFQLTVGPQMVSIVQGQAGITSVATVAVNGFNSPVTLSATGLPTGVTAMFGTAVAGISTLTLTSASNTLAGIYPITIQGTSGGLLNSTRFTLVANNVGQIDVLTQHNDIGRTGQNVNETVLTPANVSGGNFGKLFSTAVDGQVYAQPLYVANLSIPNAGTHNVVFVVTMHDSVYAFDADTPGPPLWQVSLLDAAHGATTGATTDPQMDPGCDELTGSEIGIASTPVIDPGSGTIYLVGKTFENGYPVQRLHALDITNGAEKVAPATLSAAVAGTGNGASNGVLTFDPKWENQRPGLLLVNGIVYMAFASYCDNGPYHGWVLAYNASTLAQTSVFTPTPNGGGSGIWLSGAGLAADIPPGSPFGRMFVATGNGTFDAVTPLTTNIADYGDDVVKLDLTDGVMRVTDQFTPLDQANLLANDLDLAAGGVLLMPDQTLAGHTHQLLAGGKTGNIYVVDRDSMGGYSTTANNIIETITPPQVGGIFSVPAYWNNHVYYWGNGDSLTQFNFTNSLMNAFHSSNSTEKQTFPGSTPAISANGTSNGIVWNIDSSAFKTDGSVVLLAHDALNVATTLYSSNANLARDNPGPAVQFAVPTISNGKVYVGAYGQLSVFGLLSSTPDFTLSASQPNASVAQGGSITGNITVTNLNGFSGNVALSVSGLPSGITATVTAGPTAGTTILTLSASSTITGGTYPFVITGTYGALAHNLGGGVLVTTSATPSFTLTAVPAAVTVAPGQSAVSNITIVPLNGFTAATTLSVTGLPAGVTATIGKAVGNVSTLTFTASGSAAAGTSNVVVTCISGVQTRSIVVAVTVSGQPAFNVAVASGATTVTVGQSSTLNVSVTPTGEFTGSVAFSASGLPSGVTASFSPASSTTGSTLTLTAATNAAVGTSTIVITGTSGKLTSSASVALTVSGQPSFSVTVASGTSVVKVGQSSNLSVTVKPVGGFTGSVAFSVSGLPSGVTGSFSPTSSTTGSTLTLTAAANAVAGTSIIVVTGTSGTLSSSANVTVTVSAQPTFTITASPGGTTVVQGQSAAVSISVVPAGGFNSAVALSVSGLPSGMTATIGSPVSGVSTLTLTASSSATPGTSTIMVTGTSGTLTSSTQIAATVSAPSSFSLSASPATATVVQGQSAIVSISVIPANGFTSAVTLSATGLPSGVTAAFSAGPSAGTNLLTLTAASNATVTSTTITVTGTSSPLSSSTSIALSVAPASGTTGGATEVNMSSAFNVYGIVNDGSTVPNGGFDNDGYAYSSDQIGTSLTALGVPFSFGTPGSPNAASNKTVTLPSGNFSKLSFLGAAVNGNQANQTFVVTYTDGTTATFSQSLSDWFTPQNYGGETAALAMPYRLSSSGAQAGTFYIYAYSFGIDSAKTVSSIALPANRNVVLLAMTLSAGTVAPPATTSVSMSSVFNIHGAYYNGTRFTTGGLDGVGYAYSSNLMGTTLAALGVPFTFGTPAGVDAAWNVSVPLPAGNFSTLKFLGAAVNGNQGNQNFVVTYTDGTTATFTQSLSDWFTPQKYSGETIALAMPYRLASSGATRSGTFNIYAYSLTLNAEKTVKSITLPANRDVTVLAITVAP